MKFKFRFASLLKLRRHQQKKEKQRLGELLTKRADIRTEYDELKKQCEAELSDSQCESVIKNRQQYAQKHAMHKQLVIIEKNLRVLEIKLKEQRDLLAIAAQKTRMMEKLKQNEKNAFIQRIEHQEQLQQNEIAIQRFNS